MTQITDSEFIFKNRPSPSYDTAELQKSLKRLLSKVRKQREQKSKNVSLPVYKEQSRSV